MERDGVLPACPTYLENEPHETEAIRILRVSYRLRHPADYARVHIASRVYVRVDVLRDHR